MLRNEWMPIGGMILLLTGGCQITTPNDWDSSTADARDKACTSLPGFSANQLGDVKNIHLMSNLDSPYRIIATRVTHLKKEGKIEIFNDLQDAFLGSLACTLHEANQQARAKNLPEARILLMTNPGGDQSGMLAAAKEQCQLPEDFSTLDVVKTKERFSVYPQDFGEFVQFSDVKSESKKLGIINLPHSQFSSAFVDQVARQLGISRLNVDNKFSEATLTGTNAGNYGGNLESTPDGKIYTGEGMDSDLRASIFARLDDTKQPLPPLDVSWSGVGHVDEARSFVPSTQTTSSCGAALAYADPLRGLNVLIQGGDIAFTNAQNRFYNFISPPPDFSQLTPESRETLPELRIAGSFSLIRWQTLTDSIQYFLKEKTSVAPYVLDDFDLARNRSAANKLPKHQLIADNFVRNNLLIYRDKVLPSLSVFQKVTPCALTTIPIAQPVEGNPPDSQRLYGKPVFPNSVNWVVLHHSVLVPDPFHEGLRADIRAQLSPHGLSTHFGDLRYHHMLTNSGGSAHCGTNVLRIPTGSSLCKQ